MALSAAPERFLELVGQNLRPERAPEPILGPARIEL